MQRYTSWRDPSINEAVNKAVEELTFGAVPNKHWPPHVSILPNPAGMESLSEETLAGGAAHDGIAGHRKRHAGAVWQAPFACRKRIT
jgi:hypothetical protein